MSVDFTRRSCVGLASGLAASLLLGVSAHAAIPTPRLKPPNAVAGSRLLQGADFRRFKAALAAGKTGNWRTHASNTNKVGNSIAQNVLAWQRALRDPNVPWDTLSHVVTNLNDWPRMTAISAKAERKLLEKNLGARTVISWFGVREPVSGEGRIALAKAHMAVGNQDKGQAYLRSGWADAKLSRDLQRRVFSSYKSQLSADDHAARVDHLIWMGRSHLDKAKALLAHVPSGQRALLDARISLASRAANVNAKINAVPAALKDSPELNFGRAQWRRKKLSKTTRNEKAFEALLEMKAPVADADGRDDVWREKKIITYWLIKEGRAREAYPLTLHHGLTEGLAFQEAEFLGGWLALSQLGDAKKAEGHFRTLYNGVSRPISKARGAYWVGRALEAQGSGDANLYFQEAASYPNTFYGQLAETRTSGRSSKVILPPDPDTPVLTDARAQAVRMLGEAGEERLLDTFSFHLDDELGSLPELAALSELALRQDARRASVRAAKQAARFGTLLTELGYPTPVSITSLEERTFDIPFTLAIARQESEFAPGATSSAKAYGMMQMIDATAKATARKHGLKYDRQQMLGDEYYAAKMGSLHLNDLLSAYNGSYILSAVAYNAGPRRVSQWIKAYGDPRTGAIDPIDWIESIPFSETRNYVQRVMENMQVYRARLNGNSAPNRSVEAISIGR